MSKRRQSQDKPQNKLRVSIKRARLVKLFAEGKTVRQASAQLKAEGFTTGTSRAVVGTDLQIISRTAPERLQDEREKASAYLEGLRRDIESIKQLSAERRVPLLLSIYDRFERLLGLAAPTKSISARVNVADGEALVGYRRFVAETNGLTLSQIESVYKFARTMKRETATVIDVPERSEFDETA